VAGHRALVEFSAGARRSGASASLLSLPAAAAGPVSAALGRDEAAYRIRGLVANNPAQRLSARFGRSRVAVTAGSARFAIALKAFGRGGALRALAAVSPVARADRVSYARGPVREWWANGPLGLEQGFDIARRPAGSGALTLSLAVSGSARLDHGTVLLPGGLRYAGLRAIDARGRSLSAWLQLRGGRVLVRVDDRGARYPVRVDPFVQQAELTPSDGVGAAGDADQFGYSVATSGSTVVVGAPYHEANSEPYSGAVYVFHMPPAGWASATQTAELTDSTLGGNEELGFSVAISSDGDTIVAGAPAGSEAPSQEHHNPGNTQGTIDVFTTTGAWTSTSTPNARLTVAGAPATESPLGGELGWSVGISGTTIVAGAPYDGSAGSYPGLAYVFNELGGAWSGPQTQAAVLTASPLSTISDGEDLFGTSVGISGNTIVVGAPAWAGPSKQSQGAAYVFTGPWSSTQTQTAQLLASDPTGNDQLGTSVAVSGNTVVAGAVNHQVGSNPTQGAAYVWVMPTTGPWIDAQDTAELTVANGEADDEFAYSVGISGNTIVAGAIQRTVGSNDNQGAVYVYTQPAAGGWKTTSTDAGELTAADGGGSDELGYSVAISDNTIVGGSPRHVAGSSTADFGAAYVFGSGSAPAVSTSAATGVSNTSAALNGTVNPNGGQTTYRFELSRSPAFGSFTSFPAAAASAGAGSTAVPVTVTVTGLSAGTVYYYRLVATNSAGSATSTPAEQFTTSGSGISPPVNTKLPVISGPAKAGGRLACSQGSWTNNPNRFSYEWSFDGTPIPGASDDTYTVQSIDEGLTLTCTVTAANAAGAGKPATSKGIAVPVPHVARCPAASGKLSGETLGLLRLGMTRAQALHAFAHSSNRGKKYEDFFCLTPRGVRVGIASPKLVRTLPKSERKLAGRVIWASTSSFYYSVQGVRCDATVAAAGKHLKLTGPFHIGKNDWYLAPNGTSTAVFKVRRGIIEEIGIGDKQLTSNHKAQVAFLNSFS
jgi:hypothetical protein